MGRIRKYWDFALTATMAAAVLITLGYLKATSDVAPNAGTQAIANADDPDLGHGPIEGRSVALPSQQKRRFSP